LQIDTYRLGPHSKGDDNRDAAEIARYGELDPLNQLLASGIDLEETIQAIDTRLEHAVEAAEAADLQSSMHIAPPVAVLTTTWQSEPFSEERVVKSIRNALSDALLSDSRVVLIGEDIESPYGGAFKATQGLSTEFPGRVRNTPISEASIVGIGAGLALEG